MLRGITLKANNAYLHLRVAAERRKRQREGGERGREGKRGGKELRNKKERKTRRKRRGKEGWKSYINREKNDGCPEVGGGLTAGKEHRETIMGNT